MARRRRPPLIGRSPFCSRCTPAANRSGSPRLMSLRRLPRHSTHSSLHHSSASSSADTHTHTHMHVKPSCTYILEPTPNPPFLGPGPGSTPHCAGERKHVKERGRDFFFVFLNELNESIQRKKKKAPDANAQRHSPSAQHGQLCRGHMATQRPADVFFFFFSPRPAIVALPPILMRASTSCPPLDGRGSRTKRSSRRMRGENTFIFLPFP